MLLGDHNNVNDVRYIEHDNCLKQLGLMSEKEAKCLLARLLKVD